MTKFQALCVGAVNHDTIAVVSRLPGDDERLVAEEIIVGHGGPAAQAAVALARLGHSVALSSSVGGDQEGMAILAGLEAEGVDVTHVRIDRGGRTPRTVVLADVTTTHRTIVTSPYRSVPVDPPLGEAEIVHVDQVGFTVVRDACRERRPARFLSVDGGNPIADLTLENVDLYAPTRSALDARYGTKSLPEGVARARAEGARIVVVTDGGRGSWWCEEGVEWHQSAVPVKVVSSLGAGDVFHGALVSAVLDQRPAPEALKWANACAALSMRAIDGRSAIPGRDELVAWTGLSDRPATSVVQTGRER